jgi:hypothetical protein
MSVIVAGNFTFTLYKRVSVEPIAVPIWTDVYFKVGNIDLSGSIGGGAQFTNNCNNRAKLFSIIKKQFDLNPFEINVNGAIDINLLANGVVGAVAGGGALNFVANSYAIILPSINSI